MMSASRGPFRGAERVVQLENVSGRRESATSNEPERLRENRRSAAEPSAALRSGVPAGLGADPPDRDADSRVQATPGHP